MTYEEARRREIQSQNIRHVEEFVRRYDPNKKTVIFLPGGLGSQLERTTKSFSESSPGPFAKYETVWIDVGIIFESDALTLEIMENGKDKNSHIIIPNGPLRFFVKPYDETENFFRNNGYNYTVFGFDWRRPIEEWAIWLEDFLRRLRRGVISRFNNDETKNPLPTSTLLCHSHGGLVAKIFLNRVFKDNTIKVSSWMEQLITVATPFYGNSTHMKRYYKGENALNQIHGAKKIAKISGSLPGPYIFLYMDKNTFIKDGSKLGLTRYPIRDADNQNLDADPFSTSMMNRYPKWIKSEFLNQAVSLRNTLTKELPKSVIDHVLHVRSGQDKTTRVELFWKNVDGSKFDPENDPSPIRGVEGPGDGTVPIWSARLAQTPDSQIFDLKLAKDHTSLMEHDETLKVVQKIIETGVIPKKIVAEDKILGVKKASTEKAEKFISDVRENRIKMKDTIATDPAIWRRIIEEVNLC